MFARNRPTKRLRHDSRWVTPILFVVFGALVLMWPLAFSHRPLGFFDTADYYSTGETALQRARDLLLPGPFGAAAPQAAGQASVEMATGQAGSKRSVPYAIFFYLSAGTPLYTLLTVFLQGLMIMVLVWGFAGRDLLQSRLGPPAAIALSFVTPLALYVCYLMPDVFAGAIVLFALLLVDTDRPRSPLLWGLASFVCIAAVLSHYGHLPLAAGLIGFAVVVNGIRAGRLGRVLLSGGLIVVLAAAVNLAIGVVAFKEVSLAPHRLPILLARSLQDGPARWYLEEACPSAGYAVCDLWQDRMPTTVGEALFGDIGMNSQGAAMQMRIRDEELEILLHALIAYPAAQTLSLLGNGLSQIVKVGLSDIHLGRITPTESGSLRFTFEDWGTLSSAVALLGHVNGAMYLLGAMILAVMAVYRPRPGERYLIAVVFVGLLLNALIFGGLSAPADRYQSRLAWLPPFLALVLLLRRCGAVQSCRMKAADQGP